MSNGTAEPEGRLCHVKKVDTFDGYGFNLHAENGKPGQYIGKVDDGSPAETAGLKQGDRILEVNGVSIGADNHKQVVQKIKALPNETKLLVVTPAENGKNIGFAAPKKTEQSEVKTNGEELSHEMFTPKGPEITKLNLTMTAAEMRAQLAAKKKADPKKMPMDFKSKFDIVKKL